MRKASFEVPDSILWGCGIFVTGERRLSAREYYDGAL